MGGEPTAPTPALGELCQLDSRPFDPADIHLTGPWAANDGGVYYIRQTGSSVAWNGMSGRSGLASDLGRDWNNVAIGTLGDDGIIKLDWMDVPRGQVLGGGTLTLRVQADPGGYLQIVKVSETGTGFGGETFTPCVPKTLSADSFQPSFTFHDAVGNGLGFDDQIAPGEHVARLAVRQRHHGMANHRDLGRDLRRQDALAAGRAGIPRLAARAHRPRGQRRRSRSRSAACPPRAWTSSPRPARPRASSGWVRMWQSFGNDAAVSPSSMARVAVLDVGDKTVAIEEWGLHQDQWLPLAQQIVDTIQWAQ